MCSLYVSEIDVGDSEPRVIVSGLRKYATRDELEVCKSCACCISAFCSVYISSNTAGETSSGGLQSEAQEDARRRV